VTFDKAKGQKPYISFRKIGTFRQGLRKTKDDGRTSSRSYTLSVFEHQDGISFSCRSRNAAANGESDFGDHFLYKLKMRINKAGEKRFIFYKIRRGGGLGSVKTSNPNKMRTDLARIYSNTNRKYKNPPIKNESEIFALGIPKAQRARLLSFLRKFLAKNGIKHRNLSGDPFSLMCQLCYPATVGFDEKTIRSVSLGSFFLSDPVRAAMKTNGKKTRKLVFGAIKTCPSSAQSILRIAKYIRLRDSLDHAQKFLEMFVDSQESAVEANETIIDWRLLTLDISAYKYCYHRLTAKQLKVLDRLSIEQIKESFSDYHITDDTFHMIEQLGANNGFNIQEMQYTSIRELHDALANIRRPARGKNAFVDYEFNKEEVNMQLCEALEKRFQHEGYSLTYAKNTAELRKQAEIMHNCSFYYHDRIKAGNYAIFCFSRFNRPEYMFGVWIRPLLNSSIASWTVGLDQAVGKCNKDMDYKVFNSLRDEIIKIAEESGFSIHHRFLWEESARLQDRQC
jgi:hypothetical protein